MATFTEDFSRMREKFDRGHEGRHEFMRELATNEAEGHAQRQQLYQDIRDEIAELQEEAVAVCHEGAAMCKSHHQWMEDTCRELKDELASFGADLKAGGKIFRGGYRR